MLCTWVYMYYLGIKSGLGHIEGGFKRNPQSRPMELESNNLAVLSILLYKHVPKILKSQRQDKTIC
jgi:hypothetical protein